MANDPEISAHPFEPAGTRYQCCVRKREDVSKLETITVEARDLEEVVHKLHSEGFVVVSAEALSKTGEQIPKFLRWMVAKAPDSNAAVRLESAGKKTRFNLFPHVSTRELISFAIQLSALLQAGVPLLKALKVVKKGTRNSYFQIVLESAVQNVSQGFALSYAISEYPKVFPSVWANLVKVGETSGNLPVVLNEIAHYQDAAQRVKSKVISAFFYPCILILFATCAVGFLLLKIIPQFEAMFVSLRIEVPFITKVVILASQILRKYFLAVVGLIVAVIAGIIFARRTPQGRFIFDLFRLKAPIMGVLVLQASIVRFARGLSILVRSGVTILESLDISSRLAGNSVVEETITQAREAVRAGQGLGAQIEATSIFPVFMTQLVSVGEESGELGRFLDLIANYYEERIDTFLARLTTLLEPILLIAVGSVIGVLVVAMILPIIEISTGVHG